MSNTGHSDGAAAHRAFRCTFGPVRPVDLVWPPPDEDIDAFSVVHLDGSDTTVTPSGPAVPAPAIPLSSSHEANIDEPAIAAPIPAVVVPMLLASAHHARVDLPAVIEESGAEVRVAEALGEDPALVTLLGQRLAAVGAPADRRDVGVVVVAVGTSNDAANARTSTLAAALGSLCAHCRCARDLPRPTDRPAAFH